MLIATLFTIAKTGKQTQVPSIDDWIKKKWYIYTILFSHKEGNVAICDDMNEPGEHYA